MSGRNWLHNLALGGCLVGAILWLSVTPALAPPEKAEDRTYTQHGTSQTKQTPAPQQEVPVDVIPAAEPISSGGTDSSGTQDPAGDSETEKQRAQADLEAQQDMAFWAMLMVVVSAVSVGIAGVAVFLVYLTLREARRTTTVVQNTLEASSRPWISVEANILSDLTWEKDKFVRANIAITYHNFGNAPAIKAYVCSKFSFWDTGENDPIKQQRALSEKAREESFPIAAVNIFPGKDWGTRISTHTDPKKLEEIIAAHSEKGAASKDIPIGICIIGCVQYWSPYSSEPKQTGFIYDLHTPNVAGNPAPFAFRINKDVALSDLTVQPHFLGSGVID